MAQFSSRPQLKKEHLSVGASDTPMAFKVVLQTLKFLLNECQSTYYVQLYLPDYQRD